MLKVTSTKLNKSTHDRLLQRCSEEGCSIAEKVRTLIEKDVNENPRPDGNTVAVLHEAPAEDGLVRIRSSRFPELDDTELMGLVAIREKPGSDDFEVIYLPYIEDNNNETVRTYRWPRAWGEISINCDEPDECLSSSF